MKLQGSVTAFQNGTLDQYTSSEGHHRHHHHRHPHPYDSYPYPPRVFPGLAWACTRKAWDDVGGLIDWAIWGGGDWHMANALAEKPDRMMQTISTATIKKCVCSGTIAATRISGGTSA